MVRSLIVSAAFISLWTWFAPRWIAAGKGVPLHLERGWPLILMVAGGAIMLLCIFDFAWTGLGTPAPFDAPRRFVTVGCYRWVRNPMYLGMGLFLAGEALLLPAITNEMFLMIAILWATVTVFILVYEEPTLHRLYGADYDRYRQHVRRWIPRLTPWHAELAGQTVLR